MTHLFCNWKSVPVDLPHIFHFSFQSLLFSSNHLFALCIYDFVLILSVTAFRFTCFRFHVHVKSYGICLSPSDISHSMVPSKSIHAVANSKISFFFFLITEWYCVVYICLIFFIHSSTDGHSGCFHVTAIVYNATVCNAAVKLGVLLFFFIKENQTFLFNSPSRHVFWRTPLSLSDSCLIKAFLLPL